jgi:hypothetical protein
MLVLWIFLIVLIASCIGIAYAMQCPAGSHTLSGGTEASDAVYCIPDVGASGPVGTSADTSTTTLPTSGTYDELYAAWERYCRWGTAGITDAQCEQLQEDVSRAYGAEHPLGETPETTPTTPVETPEETTELEEPYKSMTLDELEAEKQKNEDEQAQCNEELSSCFSGCENTNDCTQGCLNDLNACDDPCWANRDTCFMNCFRCPECDTIQEACTAGCSDTYDTCCDDCYAASDTCGNNCGDCSSFTDKADSMDRAIAQKENERYAEPPVEIPEVPTIPEAPETLETGIGEDTEEVQDFDSILENAKQTLDNAQDVKQLNLMLLNTLSSVNTRKMTDWQLEDYIRGLQPMVLNALLSMHDSIDAMKATWYIGALNKAMETEKQRGNYEALTRLQKDYYDTVEAAANAFEAQKIKSGTLDREELASLAAMAKGLNDAVAEYKQNGEPEKATKAQDTISQIKASFSNNKEESQFIAKEMLDTETTAAFNLQNDIGDFEARQAAAKEAGYDEKINKATEAYVKMLENRDKMFQSKDIDEIAQLQKQVYDSKIEAISQFQSILESDEYDSRANFALGTIYRKEGDSETARVLYGRALLGLKGTKDFDKMSAGIKNEALRHQVLADLGVTVQPASSTSPLMKRLGNEGLVLVSDVDAKMKEMYRNAELWGRSFAWSGKIEPSRDKVGEVIFSASQEKTNEAVYGQ